MVPMVVHVEDERHASGLAEAAIGEADSVGFNKLRRNCYSSKGTHCVILFFVIDNLDRLGFAVGANRMKSLRMGRMLQPPNVCAMIR